jgi:hypothetical protein
MTFTCGEAPIGYPCGLERRFGRPRPHGDHTAAPGMQEARPNLTSL